MSMIRLKSSDDQVFDVEVKVAQQSATIKTMLDELGLSKDEEEVPIPLPNVTGSILKMVIEWASHHKDDPPVVEDENAEKRTDDIPQWDKEFLTIENETLFELILAANYLDIKGLLEVTCKTIANMIKGKTPEEIRKCFKLDERQRVGKDEPEPLEEERSKDEPKKFKKEANEDESKEVKQEVKEESGQAQQVCKDEPMAM